jgi:hypothetical protein
MPDIDRRGGFIALGGKPRIFCVPCAMKISAETIRRTLSIRGAHRVVTLVRSMSRLPLNAKARNLES